MIEIELIIKVVIDANARITSIWFIDKNWYYQPSLDLEITLLAKT